MKKFQLLFLCACTLSSILLSACGAEGDCSYSNVTFKAQPVTEQDNGAWSLLPNGQYSNGGVQLVDAKTGYAYREGFQKTSDGGKSWNPMFKPLTATFFVDGNTGWTVGVQGTIQKTSNAGVSWTFENSGTQEILVSVFFVDANTGYAVGYNGTIIKTSNGGSTWVAQNSGTTRMLESVFFTDVNTGYAASLEDFGPNEPGVILKTTDGGSTWVIQNTGTQSSFSSINFVGATGWAAGINLGGGGTLLKTTDAGNNWVELSKSDTTHFGLGKSHPLTGMSSIYFANAKTGWASISGALVKSDDGGATWTIQFSGSAYIACFSFVDTSNGWFAEGNSVHVTHDGGQTWSVQTSGFKNPLTSMHFVNLNLGWAVDGSGNIYNTINGGASWTFQRGGMIVTPLSFQFVDSLTGWMVGQGGVIEKTRDGGNLWVPQASGVTADDFTLVDFTDANTGHVIGEAGVVLQTSNGGSTWNIQTSAGPAQSSSIYFTDMNNGYAVGGVGGIFKTGDGGKNWIRQNSGTIDSLTSVFFTDTNTGWIAGASNVRRTTTRSGFVYDTASGGVILKTSNGGKNWVMQDSGVPLDLYSIYFINSTTGYAVGGGTSQYTYSAQVNLSYCGGGGFEAYDEMLKTTDGGAHWLPEKIVRQTNGNDPLFSLSCMASGFCAAASRAGIWIRNP